MSTAPTPGADRLPSPRLIRHTPASALARAAAARFHRLVTRPADRRLSRRMALEVHPGHAPVISWSSRRRTDTLVVRAVGDHDLDLVIKHPSSVHAHQALLRHCENLEALAADERLGDWRRLLPRIIACDLHGSLPLIAEEYRPGIAADTLIRCHPEAAGHVAAAALAAITELHRATGTIETADSDRLRHWIGAPLAELRSALSPTRPAWAAEALDTLRARIHDGLADRPVLTAWIHGDFHPGNVLMSEDGTQVAAIIDWATAQPHGPAPVDTQLFELALQRETSGEELGDIVVHALRTTNDDALLLLTWLRHVADNLNQSSHYRRNQTWLARNIITVLREVVR